MFKTENFKIKFWLRRNTNVSIPGVGLVIRDITYCTVASNTPVVNKHHSFAILNPIDTYCKVEGKKIALRRAIRGLSKPVRTTIWKAFWEWTGSWGTQMHFTFNGKQYSSVEELQKAMHGRKLTQNVEEKETKK